MERRKCQAYESAEVAWSSDLGFGLKERGTLPVVWVHDEAQVGAWWLGMHPDPSDSCCIDTCLNLRTGRPAALEGLKLICVGSLDLF
jgi:hypothetical protein